MGAVCTQSPFPDVLEVDGELREQQSSCSAACLRSGPVVFLQEELTTERGGLQSLTSPAQLLPAKPDDLALHGLPPASWARPVSVTLHVYDVGMSSSLGLLNKLLKPLGSGAFHCGVEVLNAEWSFTDIADPVKRLGSGVFQCRPQSCPGHAYSESVSMGKAYTTELELYQMIKLMERQWPCRSYDALTRNCCHFVNEFCLRLGVGAIPYWIMHLASVGAQAEDVADTTCCRTMSTQVSASICCQNEVSGSIAYDFRGISGTEVDHRSHPCFGQGHDPRDGDVAEVNALPVLTAGPQERRRRLTPRADKWTVVESVDDDTALNTQKSSCQRHQWWRHQPLSNAQGRPRRVISLGGQQH